MNKDCDNFPIRHIAGKDVPVYDLPQLAPKGYLLYAVEEQDQQCGQFRPFLYHLPTSRLTPGSNFQPNVYSVAANGATVTVPDQEVRAGYVFNNTPHDVRLATKDPNVYNRAQFLILGRDVNFDGNYLVQGSAFYTFPNGHKYIVGYDYYLGPLGQPITGRSLGTNQKLFTVIDKNTILVQLDEGFEEV